jgi:hypothetical protein
LVGAGAYYLARGGWVPQWASGHQIASVDPIVVAASSISKEDRQSIKPQFDEVQRMVQKSPGSQRTIASQTLSESETVVTLARVETGAQPSQAKQAVRALARESIKLLTERGKHFAAAGDLVTARLLFQRAADAGDAVAATALGATYDPIVLAKLGVVWIDADVEKARHWYEKAAHLGSPDAKRRLELLAGR